MLLINSSKEIYLEIALSINKEMYASNYIPYHIFKTTEEELLKKIKSAKAEYL